LEGGEIVEIGEEVGLEGVGQDFGVVEEA